MVANIGLCRKQGRMTHLPAINLCIWATVRLTGCSIRRTQKALNLVLDDRYSLSCQSGGL